MILVETVCACCGRKRFDVGAGASTLEGWTTTAGGRHFCSSRRCRAAAEQHTRERVRRRA